MNTKRTDIEKKHANDTRRTARVILYRTQVYRSVQILAGLPLNIFLLITLNDYSGLLGSRAEATPVLYGIAAFTALLTTITFVLFMRRRVFGFLFGAATFFTLLVVFAYSMGQDVMISCIGILFNAYVGMRFVRSYMTMHSAVADNKIPDTSTVRWDKLVIWLSLLVCSVAVLFAGYTVTTSTAGSIAAMVTVIGGVVVSCRYEWRALPPTWRRGPYIEWGLIPVIIAVALYGASLYIVAALLAVRQIIVLVRHAGRTRLAHRLIRYLFRRPAQLLCLSFVSAIAAGSILLSFPIASGTETPISFIDAFFTATSATCVTGLIVKDTPVDFSIFGQSVIIILCQIGGLGIMTISTFAAIILKRNVGLSGEYSLTRMIDVSSSRNVYKLIIFICLFTLVIEIIGALLLTLQMHFAGMPLLQSMWHASFHAISAFCNAGFSVYSDSLTSLRSQPGIILTISFLIIIGGLGFSVLYWIWERFTGKKNRSTFHVKTVLIITGLLLVAGTIFIFFTEYDATLAGMSLRDKLVNAWFFSVTPRTAGFNTVELSAAKPVTQFFTMIFMFIGVAPGSTGGGIKITTLLILIMTVLTVMRGDDEVQGYGAAVSYSTVFRAAAVFILGIAACVAGFLTLLALEDIPFKMLAFETVSAFGTVGLSMGATPLLSYAGKLVIIILMFVGRVGPLTLVLSMQLQHTQKITFPHADVMVG